MHRNSRTLHSIRAAVSILAVAGLSSLAATAQAQSSYTLTDLGTLGGSQSFATGVNNSGQVIGNSLTGDGRTHGFITGAGGNSLKDLGITVNGIDIYTGEPYTTTGTNSYALGINNKGQVAGYIDGGDASSGLGFVSTANGGMLQALNLNSYTRLLVDVNDKGQVAGAGDFGNFFYDPSVGQSSYIASENFGGVAINNSGEVVGETIQRKAGVFNVPAGYDYNGGDLGGPYSTATDVNDHGDYVGGSLSFSFEGGHAFLCKSDGSPTIDIGSLAPNPISGGPSSEAYGINNKDQVVGSAGTALDYNVNHAFLWENGVLTDLNDLISPGSGFTLTSATAISDTGYIVGNGTDAEGLTHAFLLTPAAVPEASSVVSLGLLLLLGAGGLAVRKRRAVARV